MLRVNEDRFVQHKAGVIDDETWFARADTLRTVLATPGGRRIWAETTAYRADFRAWVDSSEAREGSPAV